MSSMLAENLIKMPDVVRDAKRPFNALMDIIESARQREAMIAEALQPPRAVLDLVKSARRRELMIANLFRSNAVKEMLESQRGNYMANDAIGTLIRHWRSLGAESVGLADLRVEAIGVGRGGGTAGKEITPATGTIRVIGQAVEKDEALPIQPVRGVPAEQLIEDPQEQIYPTVLLQASVVNLGDKVPEGHLIEGVSVAWFEIIKQLARDPKFLFQIDWRKLEEIIAGAYEHDGWTSVLTPRSHDRGRDVIATKPGFGSIRIIDQVKAFAPGRPVTADDVRSMLGTLSVDQNVSKGVVTTSSKFAPGILTDPGLKAFMPYRLELKDGDALVRWLIELADKKKKN